MSQRLAVVADNGGAPTLPAEYRGSYQGQVFAVDVDIGGPTFQVGNPRLLFQDLRAIDASVHGDGEKILLVTLPAELESSPLTLVWNWTEDLKDK